jgi:hypothetical protein
VNTVVRGILVVVLCKNPLCPYFLKKGKRQIVGRISERGELRCQSCRQIDLYEV